MQFLSVRKFLDNAFSYPKIARKFDNRESKLASKIELEMGRAGKKFSTKTPISCQYVPAVKAIEETNECWKLETSLAML